MRTAQLCYDLLYVTFLEYWHRFTIIEAVDVELVSCKLILAIISVATVLLLGTNSHTADILLYRYVRLLLVK